MVTALDWCAYPSKHRQTQSFTDSSMHTVRKHDLWTALYALTFVFMFVHYLSFRADAGNTISSAGAPGLTINAWSNS